MLIKKYTKSQIIDTTTPNYIYIKPINYYYKNKSSLFSS